MMRSRREVDSELGGKNDGSGVFISGVELRDGWPRARPTGQRPHAASDARRNGALKGPAGIEDSEYRSARKAVLHRIPFARPRCARNRGGIRHVAFQNVYEEPILECGG